MNLVIKRYLYSKGPVERPDLLTAVMDEGNCRLAVQAYFHFEHSKWLRDNEILNPNAYYNTGKFIFKEETIDFRSLKPGDIIYAQQYRSRDGKMIDKSPKNFKSKDEWITALHSAIYIQNEPPQIWHATYIENGSCTWSLAKFLQYYEPVSVKRILE
jgi:hypothetical protein